ncbi:post-GPI attachment to proteins factor 6 [Aricia agestis]|uniref:post-GPI attachment to proteins factor 6 n=1 Tax=Aricia agestis TaxID=91739 RepID=UPI001C2069D1|nr:post-GPI attachment to proteins factor 6 [Aricia agestis]
MKTYLVLILVCSVFCNNDKEAEERKRRIIEQLTKTKPVILKDYHLVTRHVGLDVYRFRSYRSVSIVSYPIDNDVSEARFIFQSEELHLNNIGSCSPQDVVIQLKHGSFPAVNPDGYPFPKDFIDPAKRPGIHTLELLSDGTNTTYSLLNPKPGTWYGLVYIKWEDPRTQQVAQEGLVADCHTLLYTDLQVKKDEISRYISCYDDINVNLLPASYKCKTRDAIEPVTLNFKVEDVTANDEKVFITIQAESLPTDEDFILHCVFDPNVDPSQKLTFLSYPASTHIITVDSVGGNVSHIPDCESYIIPDFNDIENQTLVDLMRDDKDRFFTFDYGLPTTDIQDVTSLVNLTSDEMKTLRFSINQFVDIGGNLAIDVSLIMGIKYYMGYKRELVNGSLLTFTEDNQFFKVVICLNLGHPSIPLDNGYCKFNDHVKPANFILNSTDSDSIYDKVIIPYPESGTWYISFRMFCDSVVCPCRTSHNGTKYYVETKTDREDDVISSNSTREGASRCNATVVLSVSSASCLSGQCSNYGNCAWNTFSGLVISYCSCSAGYGGWDCSDDSRMDSRVAMIVSVLLLTLSNLLFLFSVYIAIIRMYYSEALIYAFTMVFSTFYHACDAPAQVSYCIIRGNVLQFGDFYCGLMSFWMTLIAMSTVPTKHFLQLVGAIVIALFTTWNMHSFLSFLLPVATGGTILLASWYIYYRVNNRWRYPRSYYSIYFPIGLVLVSIGLICYAFLQTEQNYKIVHSIWHAIVAISVVFLLPDGKRRNVNPFLPNREYYKGPLWRVFNLSRDTGDSNHINSDPSGRLSN